MCFEEFYLSSRLFGNSDFYFYFYLLFTTFKSCNDSLAKKILRVKFFKLNETRCVAMCYAEASHKTKGFRSFQRTRRYSCGEKKKKEEKTMFDNRSYSTGQLAVHY